jgi:hypothetical protein
MVYGTSYECEILTCHSVCLPEIPYTRSRNAMGVAGRAVKEGEGEVKVDVALCGIPARSVHSICFLLPPEARKYYAV